MKDPRRLAAVVALAGVFAVAALSYWWTEAPLYNPRGTIDPWLYTALFVNFDDVYEPFSFSYYAARLPWIVPGRFLYGVLPVDPAYWVLHGASYCGGVVALFFLVRRYAGLAAAVVGAGTLALTPMYWNAQYWDYIDGVTITYLLAGLCFGLPLATGGRRATSLAAAGFFFTAAVTTNPFVALIVVTYLITYFFVQPANGLRQRVLLTAWDLAAASIGTAALVVALGLYARSHGGPFLYFEPQLDVIGKDVGSPYKMRDYEWLRDEPRLLVPVFLLAVAAPLLVLGRGLRPFRFAVGSIAGLLFFTAFIYGWEFLGGGAVLEFGYYFSYFTIPIALSMASIAALVVPLVSSHRSTSLGVAIVSLSAAVVALGLLYHEERSEWTGRAGARISIALMVIAALTLLVAVVAARTRAGGVAGVLVVGGVALASHFAINSSTQVFEYAATAPENGSLYRAALDNAEFVDDRTKEGEPLPAFWYRGENPFFTSIQSVYFYAYTAIGWDLPKVTAEVRQRLSLLNPPRIVLLCEARDCNAAPAALRRAGYRYTEDSARRISRGPVRLWSVLLRIQPKAARLETRCSVLEGGDLLRASPATEIYAYWAGRRHWIVSVDVLLSVFGPNALSSVKEVSSQTLRQLQSGQRLTSPQVWARIRARGSRGRPARRC